jgi:hypothetical protein
MTTVISPPPLLADRPSHREIGRPPTAERNRARRARRGPSRHQNVLGRYVDCEGMPREVVARQGLGGSVLVIDCDAATLADRRLVAHLGADEPRGNAALVCTSYLEHARRGLCRCRPVTAEDLRSLPFSVDEEELLSEAPVLDDSELLGPCGRSHRLELVETGMTIPELRWRRHPPDGEVAAPEAVSVRGAIASLESYEPVRMLTLRALLLHRGCPEVSTTVLRGELQRVQESPIVLNRALRIATLSAIKRQGLSMSEIAIRCGRVKRDRRGKESGETSWLVRRIGLLPEGGRDTPTPWVHSDVLALIARRGLGVSPREVELG